MPGSILTLVIAELITVRASQRPPLADFQMLLAILDHATDFNVAGSIRNLIIARFRADWQPEFVTSGSR